MSRRKDSYYCRIVAAGIGFTLFGLGGLLLGYVIFPLVALFSPNKRRATLRCRRLIQLSFRGFVGYLAWSGYLTWQVRGAEQLAKPGSLVIANHPTLIDIVFLIAMIPNATCIVKASLYKNVFTRGPVSWAGYIPNNEADRLMADSEAQLTDNATLVIFPEGSRSVPDMPLRFKRGAAHLWLRSRCELSLVTIAVNPLTLAKHQMWYQVPCSRPHFHLVVKSEKSTGEADNDIHPQSIDTRTVTRRWQDHFTREITT